MSVDILGTSWDQCRSMVHYSFTSTETRMLVRTDSPGRPPRLSHSSWTMIFSTQLFFLPLNHWTTSLPVALISSSCMFRLASSARPPIHDSFVFHPLITSLLVDTPSSINYHYSGTISPTLSDILLPQHYSDLSSGPIFSPLNTE